MSSFKAHADSNDIEKIQGLLKAGLYISNTMLVMEKTLEGSVSFDDGDLKVEMYDRPDLEEYLQANSKGFGEMADAAMILEELAKPEACIYVIRSRKRIVSSITVWNHDDETVSIENVFTIPSYRERHLASSLMDYALSNAYKRGMKRARLTVYGDDTEAIEMYFKYGFKVTKVLQEFMA